MGKVHGSLARAGKVKSQTPKVEPQEKKKTPKGRAKKRITYTRRFVNVTLTGGKRKASHDSTQFPNHQYLTYFLDEPQPNHIDNYRRMDDGCYESGGVAREMIS
ncbi:40S ribosomal protein S30-B [Lachnellula subtilissima]|uniref:40S ribosomal protein S30-B n=1 Tax=Lachnellula subtilissima TaxID=602034 RepID=A0A8H8S1R5_9HELO|nr:40S ribosomal protein S30-B [Lachnellula subtilissima]